MIIVKAPRCKPIPEMNWWNKGPLYQISDVEAFSGGLKGKTKCHNGYHTPALIMTMSSFFLQRNANLAFARRSGWCGNTVLNVVKVP